MNFKDSKDREYDCVVTISTAIALKKSFAVNLTGHFDGTLYQQLGEDPELLVNVLAECCSDSMAKLGIDAFEFAKSLGGDTLENAITALRDAITDFSPPRQRAALKKLMQKTDAVLDLAMVKVNRAIDEMTPEAILNSLNSAGNKLESSEQLSTKSAAARSES